MLIIPAIDLRDGRCVRLKQGRKDDVTEYEGDPIEVAKGFQNQGAQWLHVVDLDGAFAESNSTNRQKLKSIVEAVNVPVQFGGGLRRFTDVEQALQLGVSRVVIGTLAVESPEILRTLLDSFGSDRLVVGIDAKSDQVVIRGWEESQPISALDLARDVVRAGVKRIIYTDVARDGMLDGPNFEMTRMMAHESGASVTASGGVSSLEDIKRLKKLEDSGVDSLIVGRAIYEKRFTLEEAIRAANE
ncbi:MAG: 1-(5-phosphoribosyl)-5-[(5-phosphoribosylamino)methylideneamino]imidazole-4-carboxamide isomerase [Acidobacteria bacterium]|nr:MAG: 1-(5-phosphoribosyl)-5-[(5-phosphoribosylamino)methylideneamino]imidazole-4-carboxamide isomerase [Acidobacteriota bacterium]